VYDASYRRLVVQLFALSGDQAEAEDVVQEAFVKAIGQASRFAHLDNPEAWLRTVAMNALRNRWRRTSVLRRITPRLPGAQQLAELSPDHVDLVAALRRLSPELREVVVLHHLADLPVAEVSTALGVPEGTVKARLVRGRSELGPLLSDREEPNHV
jgi:RNA polymerase sigma-70 factor (sigma-E family)